MTKILKEILRPYLSQDELNQVAGGFDLIGDIAIVKVPSTWEEKKRRFVGEALTSRIPRIKSVWNQLSPFEGEFRIRRLEHLAGEVRTKTIYREHGIKLFVDVEKVYFSPRLSEERLRVAKLVTDGERVFNMFSGVGSFSILIAKKVQGVRVYSSELNPEAYRLMVENIKMNKVEGSVIPLLGDCREHSKELKGKMQRVIMSLPEKSHEFFKHAVDACSDDATIHYYRTVQSRDSPLVKAAEELRGIYSNLLFLNAKVVTEVAPHTYEVVLDVRIKG